MKIIIEFGDSTIVERDIGDLPSDSEGLITATCNSFDIPKGSLSESDRDQILNARDEIIMGKEECHIKISYIHQRDIIQQFDNVFDFLRHHLSETENRNFWIKYTTWPDLKTKLQNLFVNERFGSYQYIVFWDPKETNIIELAKDLDPHKDKDQWTEGKLLQKIRSMKNTLFICEDMDVVFQTPHHYIGGKPFDIKTVLKNIIDPDEELLLNNNSCLICAGNAEDYVEVPRMLRGYFEKFNESSHELQMLEKYARNLTAMAKAGKLSKIIGRDDEIDKIINILTSGAKYSNVMLLAKPGVGKTAMVEGLAQRIACNDNKKLKNLKVFELNYEALTSNLKRRETKVGRFNDLLQEVEQHRDEVIVFIDEIHKIMNNSDIINILKTALRNGYFPCIGATTSEEFRKYVTADPPFKERFQLVHVDELAEEYIHKIIRSIVQTYNQRTNKNIKMNDKMVDYLYHLCKQLKQLYALPRSAEKIMNKLLIEKLPKTEITRKDIQQYFGPGLIKNKLHDKDDLISIINEINSKLIGQEQQVQKFLSSLRIHFQTLSNIKYPYSVLFMGPTGVGKSELAKMVGNRIWNDDKHKIVISLAEGRGVTALGGSDPSYVGYSDGTKFLNFIQEYQDQGGMIILDEFDKALTESIQGNVQDYFLNILNDGKVINNKGGELDCRAFIFVLTSNFGRDLEEEAVKEEVMNVLKDAGLKPELIRRIRGKIVFGRIELNEVKKIADSIVDHFNSRPDYEAKVIFDKSIYEYIVNESEFRKSGASNINVVANYILNTVAADNEDAFLEEQKLLIKRVDDQFIVEKTE